jgi:hypothetical protein|tara:strand:- start:280 stop:600 length:321 start_codon:yes stop_codon:yes gene_type:complete
MVATDLLPAPFPPPAATPALITLGLPRNAGAVPERPDIAHDLGAVGALAGALPRASPGRTTRVAEVKDAMTILPTWHGLRLGVRYPRGNEARNGGRYGSIDGSKRA